MSVYIDPIFSCRTVLEYSCKNLHFQNYLKIVDSSTFWFFLPKWVIFQVALRPPPTSIQALQSVCGEVVKLKSRTGSCTLCWSYLAALPQGRSTRQKSCVTPGLLRLVASAVLLLTTNYQNRQPVGILGIQQPWTCCLWF